MKKATIKQVEKLKEKGWKLDDKRNDFAKLKSSKEMRDVVAGIGESVNKFTAAVIKSGMAESEKLAQLINLNTETLAELQKKKEPPWQELDVDVKRNKKEFINNIRIKRVK